MAMTEDDVMYFLPHEEVVGIKIERRQGPPPPSVKRPVGFRVEPLNEAEDFPSGLAPPN